MQCFSFEHVVISSFKWSEVCETDNSVVIYFAKNPISLLFCLDNENNVNQNYGNKQYWISFM